jgi:predicted MFS family arabinose efflux permease
MTRDTRNTLIIIGLNTLLLRLGFRVWESIFNNFAVEQMGVRADQIGVIQAIREMPGLVGFLVGVLALFLVEMRIASISVIMMGTGIFMTAMAHDLTGLIGATLLMSLGFHYFTSSNSSALLLTVGPKQAPKTLGRLNSLGAVAALVGTAFIFLTLDTWGYRPLFKITGAVVVIGGLLLLPFGKQRRQEQRTQWRTTLRRQYWLYYTFQFLMGSRRHIFTTFAIFLLVQEYEVTAQTTTLLFLINSLIGTFSHQAFGKIVAQHGERRVLAFNFALLAPIFLGYALIPMIRALETPALQLPQLALGDWVLFPTLTATPALLILLGLFIVDQILFGFTIALHSYLQKIAVAPHEITPNISLGQTINHIAAVIVPVAGGFVWAAVGAQYTFLIGVIVSLLSLGLTRYMRTPQLEADVLKAGASI